jgi:ATP-dependent DNA helicase DinG
VSLEAKVAQLLVPGGRLATRWPRYERRDEQERLSRAIAAMLEHGGVLLAEAPTGLGKSLAYLLPAVLLAAAGRRVVIATCTRSLQDQLVERDLPVLLEAIGVSVPFVRLKGKQNYACSRLLERAESRGDDEHDLIDRLRSWAASDAEGDLDRFPAEDPEAFRRMRSRVCADAVACTAVTCRRGRECFWVRARRQAAAAPLVVVNHALLAISGEVEGLLPDFDLLVVDEAHRLEGVLLQQLERTISRHRFEEALRLAGSGQRGSGGLLARLAGFALPLIEDRDRVAEAHGALERARRSVTECGGEVDLLFEALMPAGPRHPVYGSRERYRSAADLFGADLLPLESVLAHCGLLARTFRRFADDLAMRQTGNAAQDLSAELEQLSARFGALSADLSDLGTAERNDWVYWRTSSGRGVELHGAPIAVGAHARRLVFSRTHATVLTSATLSSSPFTAAKAATSASASPDGFAFVAERLGLGEVWGVPFEVTTHPSPFALAEQMRTFVHDAGEDEADGIARLVAELAGAARNQLVLFTAHERLRRARERLRALLPREHVLLAQEWDGPAGRLAERFRRERGAILLGVQSLWEGVDFPGEALEILVMAKLPFSVPDDPLVEARGQRLRDQGLDPFRHDAVPEAVLRFRQGIGRLIRRADDRGVLVVCDPRLLSASYRGPFLAALPSMPQRCRNAAELASEATRFLESDAAIMEE